MLNRLFHGTDKSRFVISKGRIRDQQLGRWLTDINDVVSNLNTLDRSLQQVRQQLEETRVELQHKDTELWNANLRIQQIQDESRT